MISINRPTTTPTSIVASVLADKLLEQADLLERTRTSLAAFWWDCDDLYERALLDAISHSFGLYAEDLCLEAAALLGKPADAALPQHIDRSGVVVRVNSIYLLMDLLKQGYDELCQEAAHIGALSNQQCEEFSDMHAAFVTLFETSKKGIIFEAEEGVIRSQTATFEALEPVLA